MRHICVLGSGPVHPRNSEPPHAAPQSSRNRSIQPPPHLLGTALLCASLEPSPLPPGPPAPPTASRLRTHPRHPGHVSAPAGGPPVVSRGPGSHFRQLHPRAPTGARLRYWAREDALLGPRGPCCCAAGLPTQPPQPYYKAELGYVPETKTKTCLFALLRNKPTPTGIAFLIRTRFLHCHLRRSVSHFRKQARREACSRFHLLALLDTVLYSFDSTTRNEANHTLRIQKIQSAGRARPDCCQGRTCAPSTSADEWMWRSIHRFPFPIPKQVLKRLNKKTHRVF